MGDWGQEGRGWESLRSEKLGVGAPDCDPRPQPSDHNCPPPLDPNSPRPISLDSNSPDPTFSDPNSLNPTPPNYTPDPNPPTSNSLIPTLQPKLSRPKLPQPYHSIIPGIIKSDLTDHFPIFCSIKLRSLPNKKSELPMLKSITTKQKLYITHFVNGSWNQKFYYKSYANKLNNIKLAAKKRYYLDELQKYRYNAFKTWNTIKSLLPSSSKISSVPTKIKVGDDV